MSPRAAADPIGECTAGSGVIVVVDFAPWGGDVERGCASGGGADTGYDALYAAGFTTAGDDHDGPAFICRIDDEPPPSEDPCITTPPADAYWSYWHADAGQNTWTYSQSGAMSYHPPPGSVDAWVFGGTNVQGTTGRPAFSPAEVRATNRTPTSAGAPTTTAPPPTVPPGSAVTAPPGSTPSRSVAPTTSVPPTGPPRTRARHPDPGRPRTTTPTSRAGSTPRATVPPTDESSPPSSVKIVAVGPAARAPVSSGPSTAFLVGVGLVGAAVVGGGVVAWRRRSAARDDE